MSLFVYLVEVVGIVTKHHDTRIHEVIDSHDNEGERMLRD